MIDQEHEMRVLQRIISDPELCLKMDEVLVEAQTDVAPNGRQFEALAKLRQVFREAHK